MGRDYHSLLYNCLYIHFNHSTHLLAICCIVHMVFFMTIATLDSRRCVVEISQKRIVVWGLECWEGEGETSSWDLPVESDSSGGR